MRSHLHLLRRWQGKTTCAFGLALRCAGVGEQVRIAQFLKGGDSGEVTAMQTFSNVELLRAKQGTKFTFQMNAEEKAQAKRDHTELLRQAFADTSKASGCGCWCADEMGGGVHDRHGGGRRTGVVDTSSSAGVGACHDRTQSAAGAVGFGGLYHRDEKNTASV